MVYFTIPNIGELSIEKVLFKMDIPLMMICKDEVGNRYTALCIDDEPVEKYMVVQSQAVDIVKMLTQKITMRELFTDTYCNKVWYLRADTDEVKIEKSSEILDENLPLAGKLFLIKNSELNDYIKMLEDSDTLPHIICPKHSTPPLYCYETLPKKWNYVYNNIPYLYEKEQHYVLNIYAAERDLSASVNSYFLLIKSAPAKHLTKSSMNAYKQKDFSCSENLTEITAA